MPRPKKTDKKDEQITELTADLQRLRADFENYRKQVEREVSQARRVGAEKATLQVLSVIDTIDRAVAHIPDDIKEHAWVRGIAGLSKQLDKVLNDLNVKKITAATGTPFDPELHQAAQFDEESDGETEVIAEELQAGYLYEDRPLRHAVVRVTKQ